MRINRWFLTALSLLLAAAFALHAEPSLAASKIGVASAVKNRVEGSVGGGTRQLSAGSEIFTSEVVRTGDASTAQLLFLDQTSLSIGPKSEVTLDRFVFDPNRGAGSVAINASRGAFRFISGSQKSSSYQIKTPVATVGVRGSIFQVYVTHAANGQPVVYLIWVEHSGTASYHGQTFNLNAGQMLILTLNGIQGPFNSPWSGHLAELSVDFLGQIDIPDGKIDLLDQLNARGGPPPPQSQND
ncbi:MAG: FecR domain-containing protein [Xanthobacteraceae bacterium]|nr:FecR domain-containing protein [Xanthobacteraceae bacterium]